MIHIRPYQSKQQRFSSLLDNPRPYKYNALEILGEFEAQTRGTALVDGGLPPLGENCTADMVYRECFKRVALQNAKFYSRFLQNEDLVRSIVLHLEVEEGTYYVQSFLVKKFDDMTKGREKVLFTGEVPVTAAVDYKDMYVSFKLSDASAAKIRGIRTCLTNEYMHSGIREDGPKTLTRRSSCYKCSTH
ncbi:hypothetical protein R1flu_013211 [Riccia fluitans]|uniref:Uncharacterized protein n=1 Tax=Riccia fluitans TaxID=41844 RepID=A0ABD1YDB9_9MARC